MGDVTAKFKDKVLVITGGTGSFGSTVLKHFLSSSIKEIRIISRDEKKQDWMRHALQAQYPEHCAKRLVSANYAGKIRFSCRNEDSLAACIMNQEFFIQFHSCSFDAASAAPFIVLYETSAASISLLHPKRHKLTESASLSISERVLVIANISDGL